MAAKSTTDTKADRPGYRRLLLQPSPIVRKVRGKLIVSDPEPHFVWLPEPSPTKAALLAMACSPTLH
jgi:hypothetical protein